MKRAALTLFALCTLCGCSGSTSEADFRSKVRLHFAASDAYDLEKTIFLMDFQTTTGTIWPGGRDLSLFLDGKSVAFPRDMGWYVKHDHILSGVGRGAGWWLTVPEMKDWMGKGEHELYFTFGSVTSNVLRVTVPDAGRVSCNPEYENDAWTKDR